MRWHDGLNIDHAYLNIHEVTSWVFWIFKRCRLGLFWISMKLSHGYFGYSWSDVMGILNIHEVTSWAFWMFMKWRHGHFVQKLMSSEYLKADVRCKYSWNDQGYFEYSKADVMDILNIRWRHWYFEYEVTLWNYSEADAMGILNIQWHWYYIHSKLRRFLNIHSNESLQEYSKYQCHCEYSKYPWRQLWKFPWRHFVSIRRRSNYIIGFITPAIGPNKSKKLTRLTAPAHNIRGEVRMKTIYMASQIDSHRMWSHVCCFSFKLCRVCCEPALWPVWVSWICLDRLLGQ